MDKIYFATMAVFKNMLNKNIITREDFEEINIEMIKKYKPVLSILV